MTVEKKIKIFKMRNRKGYAAICDDNLTEGLTQKQAQERMIKALNRSVRNIKKR